MAWPPKNPFSVGTTFNVEIPDFPHEPGWSYEDRSSSRHPGSELLIRRKQIEDKNYDLKAVNPNAKSTADTRRLRSYST